MKYLKPQRNFKAWKLNAAGFKALAFLDTLFYFSIKKYKDLSNKRSLCM